MEARQPGGGHGRTEVVYEAWSSVSFVQASLWGVYGPIGD